MAYKHYGYFALFLNESQKIGTENAKTSFKNRNIINNIKKGIY